MRRETSGTDLSRWLSIGLPAGSVALVLLSPFLPEIVYDNFFLSETGFIEIATFAYLVATAGILLYLLIGKHGLPRTVKWSLAVLLAGTIFFAGEEIDWGQVWFELSTPGVIEDVNREGQLSLHKIDGHPVPRFLFNVGPRMAATLILLLGGILSYCRTWSLKRVPGAWRPVAGWLLPTHSLGPICLLAALSTVPGKLLRLIYSGSAAIPDYLFLALRKPAGEFKEYCVALALLFYVWSLLLRLRASANQAAITPPAE